MYKCTQASRLMSDKYAIIIQNNKECNNIDKNKNIEKLNRVLASLLFYILTANVKNDLDSVLDNKTRFYFPLKEI